MAKTQKKTREQKQKEAEKDIDYLKQLENLPSDQGRKFVHDTRLEEKTQTKKIEENTASGMVGKGILTYLERLSAYGQQKLDDLDLGKGWEAHSVPTQHEKTINIYGKSFKTQQGILVIVKSPSGNVFVRGIHVSKDPEIDIKAINVLIEQAENSADNEKGLLYTGNGERKTSSGIYLP